MSVLETWWHHQGRPLQMRFGYCLIKSVLTTQEHDFVCSIFFQVFTDGWMLGLFLRLSFRWFSAVSKAEVLLLPPVLTSAVPLCISFSWSFRPPWLVVVLVTHRLTKSFHSAHCQLLEMPGGYYHLLAFGMQSGRAFSPLDAEVPKTLKVVTLKIC